MKNADTNKTEKVDYATLRAEDFGINTRNAEKRLQDALKPIIDEHYPTIVACVKDGSDALLRWMAENHNVFFPSTIELQTRKDAFWKAVSFFVMMNSVMFVAADVSPSTAYLCTLLANRAWDYVNSHFPDGPQIHVVCMATYLRVEE